MSTPTNNDEREHFEAAHRKVYGYPVENEAALTVELRWRLWKLARAPTRQDLERDMIQLGKDVSGL